MSVLRRDRKPHTQTRREVQVKAETDAATAGEPGAGRDKKKILTQSLQRECGPTKPWFGISGFYNWERINFCFKPPTSGNLPWQT